MPRHLTCVVIATLALAACRSQPSTVALQGAESDISVIAGQWAGEYSGAQSGRSGSILFTVQAGTDTAYGDVMMTPQLNQTLRAVDFGTPAHDRHVSSASLLRITFVRVRGGRVEGSLEPYVAPDCNCVVSTVFRGTLQPGGKEIKGEFETRGEGGLHQTGAWSVKRGS
jgi:hypothetical protein